MAKSLVGNRGPWAVEVSVRGCPLWLLSSKRSRVWMTERTTWAASSGGWERWSWVTCPCTAKETQEPRMPRSQHHRVLTGSDPGALASASLISRPHRSPPCPSKMCLGYRPHLPSQSISFSSLLLPLHLGFPLPSTRTLIGAPATPHCRTQCSTCRPHLMCWWPSHRGALLLLKPSWFGIQVPGHLASCGCCWSQLICLPWGSPQPPLESAFPQ